MYDAISAFEMETRARRIGASRQSGGTYFLIKKLQFSSALVRAGTLERGWEGVAYKAASLLSVQCCISSTKPSREAFLAEPGGIDCILFGEVELKPNPKIGK